MFLSETESKVVYLNELYESIKKDKFTLLSFKTLLENCPFEEVYETFKDINGVLLNSPCLQTTITANRNHVKKLKERTTDYRIVLHVVGIFLLLLMVVDR